MRQKQEEGYDDGKYEGRLEEETSFVHLSVIGLSKTSCLSCQEAPASKDGGFMVV